MDLQIAAILLQDGMANGAIYTMLALGFVLVFTTTRIIFASYGDLIALSALTLHALQNGRLPGTVSLVAILAVFATTVECWSLMRAGKLRRVPRAILIWLIIPVLPVAGCLLLQDHLSHAAQIALTVALVMPIAPLLYRLVFQPIERASTLTLLIVALVLHYVIAGFALLTFGAEGVRTAGAVSGSVELLGVSVGLQVVAFVSVAALFSTGLALFFRFTMAGKALRATAYNSAGASLVGISTRGSAVFAFLLAGVIAAIVGILIGPTITIYYDSGLMIGLKGFVGAVLGGFVSYPLAALGSVIVGLVEAYASFFASLFK
ncbi:branched-chain amino acid ABC transporter permease [Chelatococcus asaccharovorans]|uniref:Branched-chain amino acid transport system permease protein n=1 Tax=Chelatococcus asaccharovorans TaxID=28210 RepID=A0A2V3TTK4_9HYPH|nr:branched-chain amino acid ABC transporter permease [Chelatococcus asaccharovorans]MBS7706117.1 branched-chain amino acid ABC transporter permease [Chelatococcus asaccharovorans]PXW52487.1 branched-chain amino acid transport system permease protein [Chelatococcus asaccharovorans]